LRPPPPSQVFCAGRGFAKRFRLPTFVYGTLTILLEGARPQRQWSAAHQAAGIAIARGAFCRAGTAGAPREARGPRAARRRRARARLPGPLRPRAAGRACWAAPREQAIAARPAAAGRPGPPRGQGRGACARPARARAAFPAAGISFVPVTPVRRQWLTVGRIRVAIAQGAPVPGSPFFRALPRRRAAGPPPRRGRPATVFGEGLRVPMEPRRALILCVSRPAGTVQARLGRRSPGHVSRPLRALAKEPRGCARLDTFLLAALSTRQPSWTASFPRSARFGIVACDGPTCWRTHCMASWSLARSWRHYVRACPLERRQGALPQERSPALGASAPNPRIAPWQDAWLWS